MLLCLARSCLGRQFLSICSFRLRDWVNPGRENCSPLLIATHVPLVRTHVLCGGFQSIVLISPVAASENSVSICRGFPENRRSHFPATGEILPQA